jgi:Protein of unknown function (DUF3995)
MIVSADQASRISCEWPCASLLPTMLASLAFAVLGVWHFYMAFAPSSHRGVAVPSVRGRPVFQPSRAATIAVGVALLLAAALVAATGGLLPTGLPAATLRWASAALASGLVARAVGDFKYVGFFKRIRDSKFAKLDTCLYSPVCVLLGAAVALVAHSGR